MAKQVINVGTADFAGDGDGLRTAFTKVNDNFTELYDDDAQDITLASFSATQNGASGGGVLTYSNITGVFTYTPPDLSGFVSSDTPEVAIGQNASAGSEAIAIGKGTAGVGDYAQAIGNNAGNSAQGVAAVAIGSQAGETSQGDKAIAIGQYAGRNNQAANSIVLNATGATLENTTADSFVVKPIRNASGTHSLEYNPTTGEVTYDTAGGGAADTDALPEGTTNLYYTDARVNTYLSSNDYDTATNIVASITDSAPGTLDTLNELAAALGDDPNFATTVTNSIAEKLPLAGGTIAGDIDGAGNKVLFANMYAQLADLPSATTYHGMFAHVHATGAGYFAHAGNWVQLANYTDLSPYLPTANLNTNIDLHLNQAGATSGQILSWDGSDYAWVADQTGGGSQNLFSTVASSGQNDIVADGTTDKLYIEAGTGISIATDQNTDTLTITATGGGGGLADVIDDTSPQLGGTLDLNSNSITSQGNISIQTVSTANAIDIGTSSFTGSAVNIGSQALSTPVNISGESNFGAHATFDRGVHERFYTLTGATGTVTHNCWWGHLWYHTGVAANFTANITNLGLEQEDATNVAIIINQGNTPYIPNAIEIAGVAQTIIWQGNSAPTGTANGTDTFSFTILNDGGTYVVLGQMTAFGGV